MFQKAVEARAILNDCKAAATAYGDLLYRVGHASYVVFLIAVFECANTQLTVLIFTARVDVLVPYSESEIIAGAFEILCFNFCEFST